MMIMMMIVVMTMMVMAMMMLMVVMVMNGCNYGVSKTITTTLSRGCLRMCIQYPISWQ